MAKFFLKNPGFELGDQDWAKGTGWTIAKDTGNARSGDWVAKKTAGADNGLDQSAAVNIRPGGKLTLFGWYKHTATYDAASLLELAWLDKDAAVLSSPDSNSIAAGTTTYTQAILTDSVAPDRTKSAIIRARPGVATLGNLWLDDLDLSGGIVETLPAISKIRSHTLLLARTIGAFDPLIGDTKFSDFNAGMSDKWAGVFTFIPLHPSDDLGELLGFLERLEQTERFFAFDPDRLIPKNGVVNNMTVNGATTQGTSKIPVKAGPVSSTALVAGDYMEVKDQYFQLIRDLEIGPEGTGEAIVTPAVRSTLADGEDVITDNPKMVARFTSEVPRRSGHDKWTQLTMSWKEV